MMCGHFHIFMFEAAICSQVYYIPQADVNMQKLQRTGGSSSYCEWKVLT